MIDAWYYLHKSIARSIKNSFITVFLGVTQFIACIAIDKLYQDFPADNLVLNKPCYFFCGNASDILDEPQNNCFRYIQSNLQFTVQ